MSTLTFDTLKYAERLKAAGVAEPHAKAEAEALRDVLSEALDSTLSTKADIAVIDSKIDDLRKDMQAMELRLTIKLGAFIAVAVGILIAVLRIPH